jgi:hypothetical protein
VLERILPRSYLLLIIVVLGTAACQELSTGAVTPTAAPTATPESTPDETPIPETTADWEQIEVNGVQLGIEIPYGWEVHQTDVGLLIAEHFATMESGTANEGMEIYLFVHSLDYLEIPTSDNDNVAWAALEQISKKRDYIGDALVSAPMGFQWDGHDAAYYLLNDNDVNFAILVAVALKTPRRLVVCRFSSPAAQASGIRLMLPEILSTLTINGLMMDISALRDLPDPLQFPKSNPASQS